MDSAVARAVGQVHKTQVVAERLGERLGLAYVERSVAPSVLYATELVRDRRAVERLDKAWEKHLAAATLTGRANTWWSDEPLIRREGLRWHGGELPWGAQVRQRAAGLAGRLARPGRALAQQLLQKGGDVGGFLTTGLALVQESGCRLPLPTRKVRQGRWKGRVRNVLRREHALGAARARGRAGEDRSDCLMLATLGDNMGQVAWGVQVSPQVGQRVQVHKLKLGVVKATRVARAHTLSVEKKWQRMPVQAKADFLRCPCGAARQSISHVWKGCPVAAPVLVDGLGGVPGVSAFDKFAQVLSPRTSIPMGARRGYVRQILANVKRLEGVL